MVEENSPENCEAGNPGAGVRIPHAPPYGPVVELAKTSPFHGEEFGFDPRLGHFIKN